MNLINGEREHWPTTFWCDEILARTREYQRVDWEPVCCGTCHTEGDDQYRLITIYPPSGPTEWNAPTSGSRKGRIPDMGLGIHASVCCRLIDLVRDLPRSWWLGQYGEKHGYSA